MRLTGELTVCLVFCQKAGTSYYPLLIITKSRITNTIIFFIFIVLCHRLLVVRYFNG
jgi:hypothetical protein